MKRFRSNLRRLICRSPFPLSFLLRNFKMLGREECWVALPQRLRRAYLLRLVEERSRFFLEVLLWKRSMDARVTGNCSVTDDLATVTQKYCTHCGACCEISSGMPDFQCPEEIPIHWQKIFGEGLGRGHRFCPFLWEDRASRRSLCAIHPWRPAPCRLFEEEECEYLKEEPGFAEPTCDRNLSVARRWLIHLIDSC